jgi:1-phosphatidylinositol phosphodiesterase
MEKKTKKALILGVSLGLPISVLGVFGLYGSVNPKVPESKAGDWLGQMSDLTLIKDISLPGSHDTMALYSIGDLAGRCQSLSLASQLDAGVRFLDIRLQNQKDTLKAVHGIVDEKEKFPSIVNTIDTFLTEHPTEFLIVSIKEEEKPKGGTKDFETLVVDSLTEKWYTGNVMPATLGQVRGKAILLSRYADSKFGVPAYEGWQDSATFTLPNLIHVQDEYKINDIQVKKDAIKKCLETTNGLGLLSPMTLNFFSAYRTSYFPPSYAPSVAKEINMELEEILKPYQKTGIAILDFITESNAKLVISHNKGVEL